MGAAVASASPVVIVPRMVAMLIFILSIRAVGIWLCLIKTNLTRKERLFCTLTGIPKATVQAAIGGIPLAMGLPMGELILAVAVVVILVTAPIGALLLDSTYRKWLTSSDSGDSASSC